MKETKRGQDTLTLRHEARVGPAAGADGSERLTVTGKVPELKAGLARGHEQSQS